MKENWTTDMKQKLEGHKMAPPAGLWEGISSEMGIQKELALKTVAIKRWQWVAAMFLALIGFFLVYQFSQDEPLPQVAHTSQKQEAPTTKEANPENQPLALADIPHRALTKVSPKTPVEVSQPSPVKTVQEVTEENAQQVSEETASQQVSEETSQQPSVVTSHRPHTEGHHQTANYHTRQTSVSSTDSQWSIGLNASGGLLAASSSSQRSIGQSDYPVSGEFNYNNFVDKVSSWPSTSSEVYDYEAKHRLPMSLGLSVYYQLNPRLAFQTGVNYTYLYSEFSTSIQISIENRSCTIWVYQWASRGSFGRRMVSAFISQVLSCFRSVSTKSPGSGLLMPLQVRSMPLRLCWVFILNLRWAITFTMAPLSSIIIKNIP